MRMWLAFVLLAFGPTAARAQVDPPFDPRARPHVEAAARHYDDGEFVEAAEEFEAAYRIDPQPRLLYAMAQAQRLSGDCRRAIRTYEAFLRTSPSATQVEAARDNIERCQADLRKPAKALAAPGSQPASGAAPGASSQPATSASAGAASAPASSPASAAVARAAAPAVPRPAPGRWYTDRIGGALCLAGLAALVAGVVVWGDAKSAIERARHAGTYEEFSANAAGAEGRQRAGGATMVVGGVLVLAGIARYAQRAWTRSERTRIAAAAAPMERGGMVVVQGSY